MWPGIIRDENKIGIKFDPCFWVEWGPTEVKYSDNRANKKRKIQSISCIYDRGYSFSEGLAWVKRGKFPNEEYACINTKNEILKRKKLKQIILALSLIVVVAVGSLGYYLYPILFPRTNYLEPMPEDSKEVELAKTWFGIGKAYLYNYSIDETYENVAINLSIYKKGELTHKETVAEFPLVTETKDGFIAVFHDYLDDEAKIMVGGEGVSGSVEFDMFKELEEAIGGSSQSRYTIAEIENGREVGLAAFYFEDEILEAYKNEA